MKWGDGSGTGTGGTTEFYDVVPQEDQSPTMELWMGTWGLKAKLKSSNWKEARTCLEALRQERGTDRLKGKLVFYVTDNLVSYYIIHGGSSKSPSLHKIVEELQEEQEIQGCHLEAVHAPGTLMIEQGTDGLSRGLWHATERRHEGINQVLFEAVPYTPSLGIWAGNLGV